VVPLHTTLKDGRAEQALYLLVGAAPAPGTPPPVRLLPDTPDSQLLFAQQRASTFFWLLEDGDNGGGDGADARLVGYACGPGSVGAGGAITPMEAWALQLSGRVLVLAARDSTEPLHTHVKVGRCTLALACARRCGHPIWPGTVIHTSSETQTESAPSC
jgi:hypothetical protein